MIVIAKPRAAGKTRDAAILANQTGAYLVVRDAKTAAIVSDITDRFPITYHELINQGVKGSFIKNFVIDDIEDFATYVVQSRGGLKVEGISVNLGEWKNG